jgi:hypothetical protein
LGAPFSVLPMKAVREANILDGEAAAADTLA